MDKIVNLLGTYSFKEQTQNDLFASFVELDDDGDGFITKKEMERYLKTMGEGLSDDELNAFMEVAIDPNSRNPDMIDIKKVAEILIPIMESTNMLASRPNATPSTSQADLAAVPSQSTVDQSQPEAAPVEIAKQPTPKQQQSLPQPEPQIV